MSGFLCTAREMDTYNVKKSLTKMKKRKIKIRVLIVKDH